MTCISICKYRLHGILLSLDVNLAQPRSSRESLGVSTGWGALPALRIGGHEVGGCVEGMGGDWDAEREWESGLIFS